MAFPRGDRPMSKAGGTELRLEFADFLSSLSPADRECWSTLTAARRKNARKRFDLFERWRREELGPDEAIAEWGKSPSRFYRLAAQWREQPSLDALGVGIRAPRKKSKLNPEIVNALQAKVAEVVRLNSDASVRRQVALLVDATGVEIGVDIGTPAVRKIVETERRRIDASGRLGWAIGLDCSAINFARPDGRPYVLFAVVDIGTALILGWCVSDRAEIASGYGRAAAEALAFIATRAQELPWTTHFSRAVIVQGEDPDAAVGMMRDLAEAGIQGNHLLANAANPARRFGSQLRRAMGVRIGRLAITPSRTLRGEALPDNGNMTPWPRSEVEEEVKRTFEEHNSLVLARLEATTASPPPLEMMRLLDHVAHRGEEAVAGTER